MELTKSQNQVLGSCFLFKALGEKEREEVFGKLKIQSFRKGDPIYTQHHFQKSLGIVLEGEAAVKKDNGTLLNLLKAGSCFGAAALFAPAEEYVTSIVAHKSCKVVFISGEELAQLFKKYGTGLHRIPVRSDSVFESKDRQLYHAIGGGCRLAVDLGPCGR